jgi:MinD-like ATPase involved in chromosome partitioning or flagellar assembly
VSPHLYTWIDVEDILLQAREDGKWPEDLVWARSYWDGLTLGIRPRTQDRLEAWLRDLLDPRYDAQRRAIILEGLPDQQRLLPVLFEDAAEAPDAPQRAAGLARPAVLWRTEVRPPLPPPLPAEFPPIVAFHSFKGGVGRTVHALALARALTRADKRVLLVDADVEAPGVSWLVVHRLPDPPLSFADVLALAHGDPDPSLGSTVRLAADRLQAAVLQGIYVLPAFRPAGRFVSMEVRPEHLASADAPFVLTELLGGLGRTLGVQAVIVDLRAGLSEAAAGLLLDPRVYRVLVTTLSDQSVTGTERVLELLERLAPPLGEDHPLPALVLTQVPAQPGIEHTIEAVERRLLSAGIFARPAGPAATAEGEVDAALSGPPVIRSSFRETLMILPPAWEDVLLGIERSGLLDAIQPLVGWLPWREATSPLPAGRKDSRDAKRKKLREFAHDMEYAERGAGEQFLATPPLRRLAEDHLRRVPVVVVVGAKGAGKTYTFLQIVRRQDWGAFVVDTLKPESGEPPCTAAICPALVPKKLDEAVLRRTQEVRHRTAAQLGFGQPLDLAAVRDRVAAGLGSLGSTGAWRERWLDLLAWSAGFEVDLEGAGRRLVTELGRTGRHLVAVLDGLEDLFPNLPGDPAAQSALQALLEDVPEWLSLQPLRPLGIVVFVRRDMVQQAVRQNSAQLLAKYEPYALKWSALEALRLAVWICTKVKILPEQSDEELQDMTREDLEKRLTVLWGRKLGRPESKEATSSDWVLGALSDFKGQIQARDMVRFLHLAAQRSVGDVRWEDRYLTPQAMRRSIEECSKRKIEEIEEENVTLRDLFSKMRRLDAKRKQVPFSPAEVGLSPTELSILEDNGVVVSDDDGWYMPEIFRQGLGFSLAAKARPRILTLYRRIQRRE